MRMLDLSDAQIVADDDYYLIDKGQKLTITQDNSLPDKLFYGCSMEEIHFPATGIRHFGKGVGPIATSFPLSTSPLPPMPTSLSRAAWSMTRTRPHFWPLSR